LKPSNIHELIQSSGATSESDLISGAHLKIQNASCLQLAHWYWTYCTSYSPVRHNTECVRDLMKRAIVIGQEG